MEVLARAIKQEKKYKRNPDWERNKTAGNMVLYIKKLKNSIEKLTKTVNQFSRVASYKIYTQRSVTFLYANSELEEKEIKKTIPFSITRIRYVGAKGSIQ